MCGIVGVFHYKDTIANERPFIGRALHTTQHRGPDANGIWWNEKNYMAGFVRLSIRDLSEHGNQPMLSACGNFVISFNGEIYNTQLFKTRLQKEGISFSSTTDTEVLLYAIANWGVDYVLENFDGIFAFAFYNKHTNQLLLARDRAGIKPLYIGHSSEGIVYSSQYDHIIQHPFCKDNALDTGALGAYLQLGYVPENAGMIDSTFLLPHGYYLQVKENGYTVHQYYDYPLDQANKTNQTLEQVLEANVQAQLVSDVPVGTFMSGGVDSPLVSYYANKNSPIQSFTIGVENEAMDESKAAKAYADIFGTHHSCKTITEKDLLDTLQDNTKAFSEPFADFSSIPTLILSKFAGEKVKVALSGDGGDELFFGYPRNLRMIQEGMAFRNNKLVRLLNFGKEKVAGGKRIMRKRHLQVDDFPAYYYRSLFVTGAEVWLPNLLKPTAAESFFLQQVYSNPKAKQINEQAIMQVVRKLEFDLHLQRILIKVDRASMYHSLEARVPLLSNNMIQYSASLGFKDCIQNGQGKNNLKQLLISHSNKELVMQPKKGFVIPIGKWLRNELKKDVEEKLMNMPSELAVHFNRKEMQILLNQHMNATHDWGWLIWSLYALVNWHNTHRHAA